MVRRHHVKSYERDGQRVSDYMRGRGSGKPGQGSPGGFSKTYERGGGSTELTSEERDKLPDEAFAVRESREYPVPTVEELRKAGASRPGVSGERHALNALQRSTQHGTPSEKTKVRELVKTRYPAVYNAWLKNRAGRDPIVIVKRPGGQVTRRQYTSMGPAEVYAEKQEEKGYDVEVKPTTGEKVGAGLHSVGSTLANLAHRKDGEE
jgi:hypothetical protein